MLVAGCTFSGDSALQSRNSQTGSESGTTATTSPSDSTEKEEALESSADDFDSQENTDTSASGSLVTKADEESVEAPVKPTWVAQSSPQSADQCKLPDIRPAWEKELWRGQKRDGAIGRNNIGFPVTNLGQLPTMGNANIIFVKVAWSDAPPHPDLPKDYLEEQAKKLSDLSKFWSQGKFSYEFQMVDGWIEIDANHKDFSLNFGSGEEHVEEVYEKAEGIYEDITRLVVSNLPEDLNYRDADLIVAYMSPTIKEFDMSIGWSNGVLDTPDGPQRIPFMANGNYMAQKNNWPYTWTWLAHDFLHYQGLNEHAPGNGWSTNIQGGAFPDATGRSTMMAVWDSFLLGWIDDSQVFCVEKSSIANPKHTVLTPLEIYGGDKKTVIVPLSDSRALVIESRRPVGYSSSWPSNFSGLLVYEVDVDAVHVDHGPKKCANSRENPKWAYYILPDGAEDNCNDPTPYFVRAGGQLTFEGVRVKLEYQEDEADFVTIEQVTDD